jgi:NAD(P)-dependent dehydrogenase (short-subunit alcohol dehydrogenase family)
MFNTVITGASRGIGLAAAVELARAGHDVVATMRNPAGSPELGEQAAKEKLPIRIETMDVDSDESVKQAFDRILARGLVDVLVNNAGIERTGAIEETPMVDFRTCIETNYFGAIRCIQAVAPTQGGYFIPGSPRARWAEQTESGAFFALKDSEFCAFIMLHEMAHFVGCPGGDFIPDNGRGWFTDEGIAKLSADKRLRNADSYATFATECRTGSHAKPPYVQASSTSR